MNRESILVLVLGLCGGVVYGALAGSAATAAVDAHQYDVTVPTEDLFAHPTSGPEAGSGSASVAWLPRQSSSSPETSPASLQRRPGERTPP